MYNKDYMLNHNSKCSNFCFVHLNILRAKILTIFIHTSSCLLPSFTDITQKSAETVTKVTMWINYLPIYSQTFFFWKLIEQKKHLQFIVVHVFCFVIYWHATSSHHNNELARNGPWEELVDCQIKEIVVGISNSLRHTHYIWAINLHFIKSINCNWIFISIPAAKSPSMSTNAPAVGWVKVGRLPGTGCTV